jgi:hypothetical protein
VCSTCRNHSKPYAPQRIACPRLSMRLKAFGKTAGNQQGPRWCAVCYLNVCRGEVTLLKNLMSAKQLSLLAELRALYPIVEILKNKEYSIRGTKIPDRELQTLPDEQISTALGYACHLVSLLAKYLQVPLRYFPQHMASRSTMRDEIMTGPVEYPLYTKGVEPGMFSNAFFMLQSDVRQLLYSQGISPIDGHVLANVSRLFTILLDAPLPASTDVIAALDATAGAAAADNPGGKATPASAASVTPAAT